jgi:hypothetical protein
MMFDIVTGSALNAFVNLLIASFICSAAGSPSSAMLGSMRFSPTALITSAARSRLVRISTSELTTSCLVTYGTPAGEGSPFSAATSNSRPLCTRICDSALYLDVKMYEPPKNTVNTATNAISSSFQFLNRMLRISRRPKSMSMSAC